ncbi:MAG TPA: aromatic ring-hydroxylating dioxygenase subunit alpha [Burkholderiaceae bacterium]|nr:aromatic ring-hydroxylating dioxygenase subunit alpha [Burkholderiaceae bacterium]
MIRELTRTGADTPMGRLLRRYWVPVLLSSELPEPDCPPVRAKILNEKLLAFRNTDGVVGLIDEHCAHRGASLFFGRNEENGIRCSYHGWKYDVTGQCVDLPQAPAVACRMKLTAYPCVERGGIVWAYMGPPEKKPDPPEIEWCLIPDSHRFVSKRLQECGWLQAMEGGIDTAHVTWVHRYELDVDPMHKHAAANKYVKADRNVIFDVEEAASGLRIFGRRNGEPDSYYWRITQWIFPWFTLIPPFGPHPLGAHVWVPIDDEHCWAWSINFYPDKPLSAEERQDMIDGKGIHVVYEPGTFRPQANRNNDYLIDRRAQKENRAYSGIAGFSIQDASLQESMGAIQDYDREHLVPTDKGIMMARRMLHRAMRAHEEGQDPPALAAKIQRVRSASVLLDRSVDASAWAKERLSGDLDQPVYTL